MAVWAFILGAILVVSLTFFITIGLIFNYQTLHCIADQRILCWADWTCKNENGVEVNVLSEYFNTYANKCLFGATNCGCDANSDMGFTQNYQSGATANPYNTGSKPLYTDGTESSPQNLCGTFYPPGLIT